MINTLGPSNAITHITIPRWVLAHLRPLRGPGYIWLNGDCVIHDEIATGKNFPCGNLLKSAMVLSNYMALI